MSPRILCVDDEPNVLSGLRRQLHGRYDVTVAESGKLGLQKIRESKDVFPVIMSDFRMPEMDGVRFLAAARLISPDSVRIMLTGQADLHATIDAVNEGNIFRFLNKPCPPEYLIRNLDACYAQYKLITAERELLEQTLRGAVKVLSDILAIVSPAAFSRASHMRTIACGIAQHLPVVSAWEVEVAAMLSQIGCVTVPASIIDKVIAGNAVPDDADRLFRGHAIAGRDLLKNIPRLEAVAEAIRAQMSGPDLKSPASSKPLGVTPLARVLQVALDFDSLVSSGQNPKAALDLLTSHAPPDDHGVVEALRAFLASDGGLASAPRTVQVGQVSVGMVIAEDVLDKNGTRLVAKGFEVTEVLRIRLLSFAQYGTIAPMVKVFEVSSKK